MPSNMPSSERLHEHDDSPTSSRPSSAASTCVSGGLPNRTTSMDSLYTSSSSTSTIEKSSVTSQEYIPTRVTRTAPKINTQAMQFVKVGPAELYKSATEQIKKVEQVKALRKQMITEEEDWQEPTATTTHKINHEDDWQSNLDKWKSSRRKRNEGALERVIEVKKNEQDEEFQKRRRKSRTFSDMMEDKTKRGRRYNLVVHDDDNNDLGDLGLSSVGAESTVEPLKQEGSSNNKDIYNDKDTKSDAGFCTGSDTGSDGVFAEDNISDTSSALGDKKEAHDSLLDCGVTKDEDSHLNGGDTSSISSTSRSTTVISPLVSPTTSSLSSVKNDYSEYTYDKAIQNYKQFAESTTKKRTTSVTSLASAIYNNSDSDGKCDSLRDNRSPSPSKGQKIGEKLNFFNKEMEREHSKVSNTIISTSIRKDKSPKVDITKRRSMFELREPSEVTESNSHYSSTKSLYQPRKLSETTSSLKSKVASFENLDSDTNKYKGVTPPRDVKFKEKLANFSQKDISPERQYQRKKTPERDQTFHQKLASFTSLEKGENSKTIENRTKPVRDPSLKNKIASFEQLDQTSDKDSTSFSDNSFYYKRDKAVSMECLNKSSNEVKIQSSISMGNLLGKVPTTPYMVVHLEDEPQLEEPIVSSVRPTVNPEAFNQALKLDESPSNEGENNYYKSENHSSSESHSTNGHVKRESTLHKTVREEKYNSSLTSNTQTEKITLQSTPSYTEDVVGKSIKSTSNDFELDANEYYDDIEPVNNDHYNEDKDNQSSQEENIYENILEEPVYENIYEKVNEDSASYSVPSEPEHYYQTLDDARQEKHLVANQSQSLDTGVTNPTSSLQNRQEPPKQPPPSIAQVYDVTWTEDSMTRVAPPSEPPPPPPPDDDSSSDENEGRHSHPGRYDQLGKDKDFQSGCHVKEEIQRRRSAFLGTSPVPIEEETTIKPPPDLSDLLREECEADRIMKQKLNLLSRDSQTLLDEKEVLRREKEIIETLEREEEQRRRYNWDDRTGEDSSDMQDLIHYNDTLAQLEMEMVQHDKEMLQRSNLSMPSLPDPPSLPETAPPPLQKTSELYTPTYSPRDVEHSLPQSSQPSHSIQEFYRAPSYQENVNNQDSVPNYKPAPPPTSQLYHHTPKATPIRSSPSQYTNLASPHPFVNSQSSPSLVSSSSSTYSSTNSPRDEILPEPLPRRKKAPPPVPEKTHDSTERLDALRTSKQGGIVPDMLKERHDHNMDASSVNMSKHTLAALSAIPKPKLADNDSWIKKKPEGKRDYSKHWLIHEAEQRRIEQHQRLDRMKSLGQAPTTPTQNNVQTSSSSVQSSLTQLQTQSNITPPNTYNGVQATTTYNPALSYNTTSTSTMSYSGNNNINNKHSNHSIRRDQATTYQPKPPPLQSTTEKPLPDSIINTLTQRVNNKNKNNSVVNGKHSNYNNNYSGDENYHDYMNADALAATLPGHGNFQNTSPSHPPVSHSTEEQRLLSVSGKKKCSLCGEELGRGAAMIIESLRLFYHIPCFKCCVCGIQLGNGKAGADVRVRNHKLHCHNCYSTKEGMKFSKV